MDNPPDYLKAQAEQMRAQRRAEVAVTVLQVVAALVVGYALISLLFSH